MGFFSPDHRGVSKHGSLIHAHQHLAGPAGGRRGQGHGPQAIDHRQACGLRLCVAMPPSRHWARLRTSPWSPLKSGAVSVEAHQVAIQRMIAAGANMMTWLAVAAEWQRDWARRTSRLDRSDHAACRRQRHRMPVGAAVAEHARAGTGNCTMRSLADRCWPQCWPLLRAGGESTSSAIKKTLRFRATCFASRSVPA